MLDKINGMDVKELWQFVREDPETAEHYKDEIKDRLGMLCWEIGRIWDEVEGTDYNKRTPSSPVMGTPNRRSMTYKLRKVAGFSYP